MNLITLSWRNIWRNKRRTLITTASVLFAVLNAIVMRSFQEGTYDRAIENMVRMISGHLQIHAEGYWDDQIIDNVFYADDSLFTAISSIDAVEYVFPRLQYFAFTSSGDITRESFIIGQNLQAEDPVTKLSSMVRWGEIPSPGDNGIVLGEALAKNLGLIEYRDSIGTTMVDGVSVSDTLQLVDVISDTLYIIGQGYHGASAAGKYAIRAIVKIPVPELNKRAVYMPLVQAQQLFAAPNMLTSLNIQLEDSDAQDDVLAQISEMLDLNVYEVMPWDELHRELVQQIESDRGSGAITIWLLYIIIGFGILGTIIMMANERKREFGIMVAIGMQKTRLSKQVAVELLYMGVMGIFAGILASVPVIWYFYINPIRFTGELAETYESYGWEAIMPVSLDWHILLTQSVTVIVLFGLSSIYALVQIFNLDVKTAIHK